jgi:thiosulfate/3-mercaptopyruvate sulfurtransferase
MSEITWVSTDWLAERLDRQALTVIDVQPNIHDYILEHIPGAVYLNEGLLRVPLNGLPVRYTPPEAFQAIARRVGLRADIPAVIYGGTGPFSKRGDGLGQTTMAYALARFDHDDVCVLDGGIDRWKAEGRPLTMDFPQVAGSDFTARLCGEYFVEYDAFKAMKDRGDVILLDARPPAVYEGQGPFAKPGHIPGAINVPWDSFLDPQNKCLHKPDGEIQALLAEHNITPDKTIICSCGTGRKATVEFIVLKWRLNFPRVLLYEGSFTEWVSYPDNVTVVGPTPVGESPR